MLAFASSLALIIAAGGDARPTLPVLPKEPTIDGLLKDLSPAQTFKLPPSAKGPSADLSVKAAFRKDTLYLGVSVSDDVVLPEDRLDLILYFPDSGLTSKGVVYRFGPEGRRPPPPELGGKPWAEALVRAATKASAKGFDLEIAVPARALPRFQAKKPLLLSVCLEYADVDRPAQEASALSTCVSGDMPAGPARLPDELRRNLKLEVATADVEGLEAREHGWVGYARLHFPQWAQGDTALTPTSLAELVVGKDAVDPASVGLPLPRQLLLADNRPLFVVLTGRDPYQQKDTCEDQRELRVALYVVDGRAASRVLEWPAANCKLGRAMRFELSVDGSLTIGYTNGSTAHFVWSGDHFERSELG